VTDPATDEPAAAPAAEPEDETAAASDAESAQQPDAASHDEPGSEPGDRPPAGRLPTGAARLDAPPSQRYVLAARSGAGAEAEAGGPSLARGAVIGSIVAGFVAALLVVLGTVFDYTAGLIIVAGFLGRLTAVGVTSGAADAGTSAKRLALSVGISLIAIAAAQVGLWLGAGLQGGVLGLTDYLDEVYGALVPLQFLLAGGIAWLSTR
jgi:hypothetical protein